MIDMYTPRETSEIYVIPLISGENSNITVVFRLINLSTVVQYVKRADLIKANTSDPY